jgi:hypothetical protein
MNTMEMGRRSDDLDTPRGQVDHEHGVVSHQAAPGPNLGGEEIRPAIAPPYARTTSATRSDARAQAARPPLSRSVRSSSDRRNADILRGALDPGVAAGRILLRHPDNELANPSHHTAPARRRPRVRPLTGDHSRCQRNSVSGVTIVAISRNARRPTRKACPASRRWSSSDRHRRRPPSVDVTADFLRSGTRAR